jgi:hypothetical protein
MNFMYTHDNATGYGRMGTQLHRAFTGLGIEVLEHLRPEDSPAPVALWATLPAGAQGWYEGQHRCLLTMWETTRLPEGLRDGLHNFEQVFVPSLQNVELYSQYHDDVSYVPLGVDPEAWAYRARQAPGRKFRFLADGRGLRKGSDVSAKAFKAAFPKGAGADPKPELMFRGSWATRYTNQDVKVSSARLDDQAEAVLYAYAHCYLAPSRGEGWGLQPLQAIAQGLPTILTNAHGQEAFADLGWGVRAKLAKADYSLYGESGDWWEPDLDGVVDHMRYVYDHYDVACQVARRHSATALDRFTWDNSARSLVSQLTADLGAVVVARRWARPSRRLYPVVLRVPHNCQVAGETFCFRAGKVYHERAEIKRLLFEAGFLDPACLALDGADTGLVPAQCERIKAVSAAHEACPTCGQQVNSRPLWEYEDAGSSGL